MPPGKNDPISNRKKSRGYPGEYDPLGAEGFEVVGEITSAVHALMYYGKLEPDLVLMRYLHPR